MAGRLRGTNPALGRRLPTTSKRRGNGPEKGTGLERVREKPDVDKVGNNRAPAAQPLPGRGAFKRVEEKGSGSKVE